MKLNNLTIAPKLGILVGVALVGLSIAGVLAGYLMQREMLNARIEQTRAIVDLGRNMAAGLQKQVEAGQLTKDAAIAEFSRRANSMTYEKGAGYLFGSTFDGITVLAQDPKQVGTNRMDVQTNGRYISRELRDGVAAKGETTLYYDIKKPGDQEQLLRKMWPHGDAKVPGLIAGHAFSYHGTRRGWNAVTVYRAEQGCARTRRVPMFGSRSMVYRVAVSAL